MNNILEIVFKIIVCIVFFIYIKRVYNVNALKECIEKSKNNGTYSKDYEERYKSYLKKQNMVMIVVFGTTLFINVFVCILLAIICSIIIKVPKPDESI